MQPTCCDLHKGVSVRLQITGFLNKRRAKLDVSGLNKSASLWTRHPGTPVTVPMLPGEEEEERSFTLGMLVPREVCSVNQLNQNHTALGQQGCVPALS